MRCLHLVLLLLAAASTSATIGAIEGVAGGAAALGKSVIGLLSTSLAPAGIIFPLALIGSVKTLIGVKALALLKLKLKAPLIAPVALGVAGKAAFAGHFKAHLVKTAATAKAVMIDAPLKLIVVKAGAIHGAIAGAKVGYSSYPGLWASGVGAAAKLKAVVHRPQPQQGPVPQPEAEVQELPSYEGEPASNSPAVPAVILPTPESTPLSVAEPTVSVHVPAPPAYVPNPEARYRKRRQIDDEDGKAVERAIGEVFDTIKKQDEDQCVRRSFCAIAVQPDLAKNFGSEVTSTLKNLSDDSTASWYSYKQAIVSGENAKSLEMCAQEYPTCTKDVQALIADAVQQFE